MDSRTSTPFNTTSPTPLSRVVRLGPPPAMYLARATCGSNSESLSLNQNIFPVYSQFFIRLGWPRVGKISVETRQRYPSCLKDNLFNRNGFYLHQPKMLEELVEAKPFHDFYFNSPLILPPPVFTRSPEVENRFSPPGRKPLFPLSQTNKTVGKNNNGGSLNETQREEGVSKDTGCKSNILVCITRGTLPRFT